MPVTPPIRTPLIVQKDPMGRLAIYLESSHSWAEFQNRVAQGINEAEDMATLQKFDLDQRGDTEKVAREAAILNEQRQRGLETRIGDIEASDAAIKPDRDFSQDVYDLRLNELSSPLTTERLKRELDDVRLLVEFGNRFNPGKLRVIEDTRAARPSYSALDTGTIYHESDTKLYYLAFDGQWHYLCGVWRDTYALRPDPDLTLVGQDDGLFYEDTTYGILWRFEYVDLDPASTRWYYVSGVYRDEIANIPTLIAEDDGFLFYATNYFHLYRWNGSNWEFGPGEPGSGFVVIGQPDGSAPNGGLWAVCDGNNVDIAQSDGTVATIATQELQGDVFLKGANAAGAQQAATAPSLDAGSHTTDTEAAHKHELPFAIHGSDHNEVHWAADGLFGTSGTMTEVTRSTATPEAGSDPYELSGAGSAHSHNLSDANLKMNAPSEANGGLPLRIAVVYYIRR